MKTRTILVLLCALSVLQTNYVFGTYTIAYPESNFVLHGRRLIFAQTDGSLTALDIETGSVLTRTARRGYRGRLLLVPDGLLVIGPGQRGSVLLDPQELAVIRERQEAGNAQHDREQEYSVGPRHLSRYHFPESGLTLEMHGSQTCRLGQTSVSTLRVSRVERVPGSPYFWDKRVVGWTLVEVTAADNCWWAVLPYGIGRRDAMTRVALCGNRLVLGTRHGQVHCVDAKTGRQHWLYLYPTVWRVRSAREKLLLSGEEEDADPRRSLGLVRLPDDFVVDEAGSGEAILAALERARIPSRLVVDPAPYEPWVGTGWLILAWLGALLSVALLWLLAARGKRGKRLTVRRTAIELSLFCALGLVLLASLDLVRHDGIAAGIPFLVMLWGLLLGSMQLMLRGCSFLRSSLPFVLVGLILAYWKPLTQFVAGFLSSL